MIYNDLPIFYIDLQMICPAMSTIKKNFNNENLGCCINDAIVLHL